jgi:hypothetical protein
MAWETSRPGGVEALRAVVGETLLPHHRCMLVQGLQAEFGFSSRSQASCRQLNLKRQEQFNANLDK